MSEEQTDTASDSTCPDLTVKDWAEKYWGAGKIGFHKEHCHSLLQKHADTLLDGRKCRKVFFPLCGKALDMKWLADLGHTVIGVEGVEQAVLEFFKEQELEYTKDPLSEIDGDLYKSTDGSIRIYRCDMFDFTRSLEGDVDAIWDRGSMVVINPGERRKYANVLKSVSAKDCRVLIITFDFDANIVSAPPHVIPEDVIKDLFGDDFSVEVLDRQSDMEDRWRRRGLTSFDEVVYCLSHK